MYIYPAGSTGLNAAMPPWALEGGYQALFKRLRDPGERARIRERWRRRPTNGRTSTWRPDPPSASCSSDFKNEKLKPLTGKTLAEVAKLRGKDPFETILDLCSRTSRASARSIS